MIDGKARTAAATAKRTRTKHDRWIRELSAAGWTVIQAGHITLGTWPTDELHAYCERCVSEVATWDVARVPLPRVLHAVTGHTCEGPK